VVAVLVVVLLHILSLQPLCCRYYNSRTLQLSLRACCCSAIGAASTVITICDAAYTDDTHHKHSVLLITARHDYTHNTIVATAAAAGG
jgi:hypothetical protein